MGHHHHHHHHHRHHRHRHHHHLQPTVIPNPAVRFHRHYAAAAPCETTPLVCNSDNHEELTAKETIFFLIVGIIIFVGIFLLDKYPTPTLPTPPEISLESLSVSNLDVTDDRISANWVIGLGLYNRVGDTAVYTDIRYSMIYCGDPSSQPIIDARKEYDDLSLPPKNQTVVYLKDAVENLGFNKMALSYMIMDVADDGILEFDLVAKVAVMTGKDTNRFVLSCEGIEVSISNSHNGAGHATHIPNHHHCDLAKVN